MARVFARLKLRLIRNGLRSGQYAVLFVIGAAGAMAVGFAGFVSLAAVRHDGVGSDATIVAFGAVTLGWTVVPLLGFGTDETLDPQRLALLPLRTGQLIRGLLVAALIGIAPIATAFGLSGSIVGLAQSPLAVVLISMAVVETLLFCVIASRALISLLAPLLRSRRGRDVMVMTVALAALVPQSFRLFDAREGTANTRHAFAEIAQRIRFTPFGIGGYAASEAGHDHVVATIAALAVLGVLIALTLIVWSMAMPRALTSADINRRSDRGGTRRRGAVLFPRLLPFLPHNRTGAIAAKELRYFARDPRRRGPLIAALILPALFLFSTLREAQSRPGATTLLALVALLPASGLTLNQFGLDGAALWSMIVAGNDARSDLTGKNIATAVLVAPLVAVPAVATAAITNGWGYLPLTIGLTPGMLGVVLAVGNMVSAVAPYALPDRQNPLAANPGQGCVGAIASMGALLVDALILVPVGVATGLVVSALPLATATIISVGITTLYGWTWWLLGRRVATNRLQWHMPELLDAVSPRQAG